MKVSIIIPAYNRGDLIGETIESIISQTYANWECIIIDDGSSDNTMDVLAKFVKKDHRIRFDKRPNSYKSGANGARNYGYELATGEYICWFDSDDLMHESYLERQLSTFQEHPGIQMVACFAKVFEDKKENITGEKIPLETSTVNLVENLIKNRIAFPTPCCVWKKDFLEGKKLFDENLLNAQESDFNFRRCTEGLNYFFLKEYLVFVRRGHSSIISPKNNYKKIQSQYDYYNIIYNYLKEESNLVVSEIKPSGEKLYHLQQFCIHRKLSFFNAIRNCSFFLKKNDVMNAIDLIKNLIGMKISFFLQLKTILGILIILFFNKGFVLINDFKTRVKIN